MIKATDLVTLVLYLDVLPVDILVYDVNFSRGRGRTLVLGGGELLVLEHGPFPLDASKGSLDIPSNDAAWSDV